MRVNSVIILVLVFALITITIAGIIGDMNNYYDVNVSTAFENQYNYASNINASVSAIKTDVELAGGETGWLSVLSGANAIWQGTITTGKLILGLPFYTTSMIRGIGAEIGIPPAILYIFILMIIVFIIFMSVRFIRGENI